MFSDSFKKVLFSASAFVPEKMKMTQVTLPNGIRVFVRGIPGAPTVDIQVRFNDAGSIRETELGSPKGTAHFLEHMLFLSSEESKPFEEILSGKEKLNFKNAQTTKEDITLILRNTRSDWKNLFSIFLEKVSSPLFLENEIEKERQIILHEDHNDLIAPERSFAQRLFSVAFDNPAYGPIIGDCESIKEIQRSDLVSFHKKALVAKETCVFVQGDVSPWDVINVITTKLHLPEEEPPTHKKAIPKPGKLLKRAFYGIKEDCHLTACTLLVPLSTTVSHKELHKRYLFNELFTMKTAPSIRNNAYIYHWFLFHEPLRDFRVAALSFVASPQNVTCALEIAGNAFREIARTGGAQDIKAIQEHEKKTRNPFYKYVPLRNPASAIYHASSFGKVYTPKEEIEMLHSLGPQDMKEMAQEILDSRFAFGARGNLNGIPTVLQMSKALGIKAADPS